MLHHHTIGISNRRGGSNNSPEPCPDSGCRSRVRSEGLSFPEQTLGEEGRHSSHTTGHSCDDHRSHDDREFHVAQWKGGSHSPSIGIPSRHDCRSPYRHEDRLERSISRRPADHDKVLDDHGSDDREINGEVDELQKLNVLSEVEDELVKLYKRVRPKAPGMNLNRDEEVHLENLYEGVRPISPYRPERVKSRSNPGRVKSRSNRKKGRKRVKDVVRFVEQNGRLPRSQSGMSDLRNVFECGEHNLIDAEVAPDTKIRTHMLGDLECVAAIPGQVERPFRGAKHNAKANSEQQEENLAQKGQESSSSSSAECSSTEDESPVLPTHCGSKHYSPRARMPAGYTPAPGSQHHHAPEISQPRDQSHQKSSGHSRADRNCSGCDSGYDRIDHQTDPQHGTPTQHHHGYQDGGYRHGLDEVDRHLGEQKIAYSRASRSSEHYNGDDKTARYDTYSRRERQSGHHQHDEDSRYYAEGRHSVHQQQTDNHECVWKRRFMKAKAPSTSSATEDDLQGITVILKFGNREDVVVNTDLRRGETVNFDV
ncbi:hypothetical protein BJ878DRAFT_489832 [Calycina marina]|uniref:Uncharacterized protein n=1 Tax=Calycina marina TaxID=1763456 RepID=A0A9P7ZAS3_9HELO|nr:hypothetical protein BJ878DRAFT_489832 [Calycina marina]